MLGGSSDDEYVDAHDDGQVGYVDIASRRRLGSDGPSFKLMLEFPELLTLILSKVSDAFALPGVALVCKAFHAAVPRSTIALRILFEPIRKPGLDPETRHVDVPGLPHYDVGGRPSTARRRRFREVTLPREACTLLLREPELNILRSNFNRAA